jgi:hypothetical protein
MKKFLVIPGGSSPAHEKYKDVYDLLNEEAEIRGYEFEILYMPGQIDNNGITAGEYGLKNCIEKVSNRLLSLMQSSDEYRIMALSGGGTPLLSSLIQFQRRGMYFPGINHVLCMHHLLIKCTGKRLLRMEVWLILAKGQNLLPTVLNIGNLLNTCYL